MSRNCQCSLKSGCKTIRCSCNKKGIGCNSNCDCDPEKCKNRNLNNSSSDNDSDHESSKLKPKNIYITASELTKEITVKVSNKRDEVFDYRNGIDIYTKSKEKQITNPQVDHIIETQILGHAAYKNFNSSNIEPYLDPLKSSINVIENYNVTHGSLNQSKGAIIRSYLNDGLYSNEPLGAVILQKTNEALFKKNITNVLDSMKESGQDVIENLLESKRTDNHVSGKSVFSSIVVDLENLFDRMELNYNTGLRTRNRNY